MNRTTPKKPKRGNVFKQTLRYLTAIEIDLEEDPTQRRNRGKLREAARAARLPTSPRNSERVIRVKHAKEKAHAHA